MSGCNAQRTRDRNASNDPLPPRHPPSPRRIPQKPNKKRERDYTVCPSRASPRGRGGRREGEGGLHPMPRCYNSLGSSSVGLPSPQHALLCRSGLVHSTTRAALPLCTVRVPTTHSRLPALRLTGVEKIHCCHRSNVGHSFFEIFNVNP